MKREVYIINKLEILEPYPNEILYSWLSRMFFWYGFQNQPRSDLRTFNMMFFGINSRTVNNILIPHNIQALVKKIELRGSKYFSSELTLINKMTFIPLYSAFLSQSMQKDVYESLIHNGPINVTKSLLGLKDFNCMALDFKLKFCYQCWMENHYMYFDIEHQVKNNVICYKHNTRLQYINISSYYYLLFDNSCINKYADSLYCIHQSDNTLPYYSQISSMVHEIYINGFRDDIIKLKSKIRMKMLSLGYMREDFNFINRFEELWFSYAKYNLLNIDKKEFISIIYSTTDNPNPIAYLTLIIYLFGSLKSYYEYEIDEKYVKIINQKPTKIVSLTQPQKPTGILYYNNLFRDLYNGSYSIVRKVDNMHYEVRCNSCNHRWEISKYYVRKGIVKCPICLRK